MVTPSNGARKQLATPVRAGLRAPAHFFPALVAPKAGVVRIAQGRTEFGDVGHA